MFQRCSTSVTLGLNFDFDNIKNILNQGLTLGYSYKRIVIVGLTSDGKGFEAQGFPLEVDDIITKLEISEKDYDGFSLTACIEDTYSDISFANFNGRLSITLSDLSPVWSRIDFDGEEEFNVQRYSLALLNLVKEYKVLEISIERE